MVFGFTDFNLGDSRQVMPLRMHWAKHIVQETEGRNHLCDSAGAILDFCMEGECKKTGQS